MKILIKVIAFPLVLIMAGVIIGYFLGVGNSLDKTVEEHVSMILEYIQRGKYDEALDYFLIDESNKKNINIQELDILSSKLKKTHWKIEHMRFESESEVLVLLYLNEEPGSVPGKYMYILLVKTDDLWKVVIDPESLFGRLTGAK